MLTTCLRPGLYLGSFEHPYVYNRRRSAEFTAGLLAGGPSGSLMTLAQRSSPFLVSLAIFFLGVLSAQSQGELHVEVRDPQGAGLPATVELVSQANQVHRTFAAESDGHCVVQDLPFGIYRLSLSAEGFARWADLIEIRSEVPVRLSVTLGVAAVTTQVQVNDLATLVDPYRTGTLYPIGKQTISENLVGNPDANSMGIPRSTRALRTALPRSANS